MKKLIDKKWFNSTYPFLINAIIMAFVVLVFKVLYETSDDAIIAQHIADGFYSIAFVSYFTSRILGAIQNLIYPINAYTIFCLLMAYISSVTITKIEIEKFDIKKATIMTVVTNAVFAVNYYTVVSFTRLPALIAVAGFLSIIHYTRKKQWVAGTIWGIVLVIISSLCRFNVFELCFGMAVAFVAALSFNDYFDIDKAKRKFVDLIKIIFEPKRFISAILVVVVAFSFNYVSGSIKKSSEEFLSYSKYTSVRSALYDYKIPDYDLSVEEYDSLGIDDNDIQMLRYGFYDLDVAYSYEKIMPVKNFVAEYNAKNYGLVTAAKNLIYNEAMNIIHFSIEGLGIITIVLALLLYLILNKKSHYFSAFIILMAVLACYFYLFIKGRVVYRVIFPILFSAFSYLLYLYDFEKLKEKIRNKSSIGKNILVAICTLVVFIGGLWITDNRNIHIRDDYYPTKPTELSEYMEQNNDKTFEIMCGRVQYWIIDNVIDNVFTISHWDYNKNYIESTGTYYGSPYYNARLEAIGTDNFYENMLNDGVYVVVEKDISHAKNSDMLQKFLQKYYAGDKTVSIDVVEELTDYTVYNYTLS